MMKFCIPIIILCCALLFAVFTSGSKKTEAEMDSVIIALKTGNSAMLSQYFDSRIDINLPDKNDNFSSSQAQMIIKDFFSSNTVLNFEAKYKGEKNGSQYCIGILTTKNGKYRTTLFMRQKGDKQLLQEISFQTSE